MERPAAESALIRVERDNQNRLAADIQIMSIDSPRGDLIPVNGIRSVSILPGEVCVGVLATTSTMDQDSVELCVEAQAGEIYEIRAAVRGIARDLDISTGTRRVAERGPFRISRIWMVDAASSAVVALSRPR